MKRPTMLTSWILLNAGLQTSLAVDKDVQILERRFEDEGMSFLTITLPSLCDCLDQALALGRIERGMFLGFKSRSRNGRLPAFMQGFFMRIFGLDGALLERPCIDSIAAIRQVTRLFKKVELPCSAARTQRAFERYVTNDACVNDTGPLDSSIDYHFDRTASCLWSKAEGFSEELYCSPGVFGSGATGDKLAFNQRHSVTNWPSRSENFFPASYHSSHREDDRESFERMTFIAEPDELPVRVVTVPKTLSTPRIISVEPSYMMLMQQSIAKPIMDWLESGRFGFKSIRFTDQTVNNEMARVGSLDGSLSTIDLSDASDLVSLGLVKRIFSSAPTFLQYLLDCRSTRAQLPDGRRINLRKFASMGSALCFPVEAMTFFTIVIAATLWQQGKRPSKQSVAEITAKISVYGDDIIVPTETAAIVCEWLEAFGLKVNHKKSFFTGYFRESCGGDYYRGHDVTPVYVRQWDFDGKRLDPRCLAAYVSLSNQLYVKGYWHVSQRIRDHVDASLRRPLARTRNSCAVLTYQSIIFDDLLGWDRATHSYRVRGPSLVARQRHDPVRDIRAGMLVCFGPRDVAGRLRSIEKGPTEWLSGHLWVSHDHAFACHRDPEQSSRSTDREEALRRRTSVLDVLSLGNSLDASVKPYSLKTKSRWGSVNTGLRW